MNNETANSARTDSDYDRAMDIMIEALHAMTGNDINLDELLLALVDFTAMVAHSADGEKGQRTFIKRLRSRIKEKGLRAFIKRLRSRINDWWAGTFPFVNDTSENEPAAPAVEGEEGRQSSINQTRSCIDDWQAEPLPVVDDTAPRC